MGIIVDERVKDGAPDGGWGWIVLLGCFVITGFSYALPKAISVYFKAIMKEFVCGYSDTAWISSIILAVLYGSGKIMYIISFNIFTSLFFSFLMVNIFIFI